MFLIVAGSVVPLLSLVSCEKLNLVKVIDSDVHVMTQSTIKRNVLRKDKLLCQRKDVFGGLGCLLGTYGIQLIWLSLLLYMHLKRYQ